ncbi:MAG: CpaF family protein [Candidatus Dadabacteria bacterium]|nr:MAG: CpaF family protein [Candidatus Dadabacteria bacterium]
MSSSKDRDSESIIGLFSTRATQTKPIDRSGIVPVKSGTSTGSSTSVSRPTLSDRRAASAATSGATRAASRSHLSPLGSTVLREARRELGSDYDFQKGQDSGVVVSEQQIVDAVEKVLKRRGETLDDIERANIIIHLQKDLMGWGVLQPLIDNREVTDIHCYDYQTVVLQRGKVSETTGIHWPSHQAYVSFIDRLLLRLGKSLSTQQHTIDASFPNGVRICAVHESVCGSRGPLLCIRVPRIMDVSLESIISYQVAPPLIVNYMASLVRCGHATIIVSGETGTGKTTLIRCLGTQFGPDESIVAVEDTPEVNFQHPYFRSLVSRPPNIEGVGEVTLQEHIKTTLRMTPTRVILGEMRTPYAAEAFLESAQTGHTGMTTVHARNARETLVRLESLLGRAQKSVSIDIIRQQIALAVDVVIWLFREKETGKPRVGEIIEVGHFVEGTIQVRPMFTLIKTGEQPVWRVDSWASNFEEELARDGIFLGDAPPELTLSNVGAGTR